MTSDRTPRRFGRPDRIGCVGRGLHPVALLVALLGAASCGPYPRVPVEVPSPPAPFERSPYLQNVQGDSAVLRWRLRFGPEGRVRYRVEDGPWRTSAASALPSSEGPGGSGSRAGPLDARAALVGLGGSSHVEYRVETGDAVYGPRAFRSAPADTSRTAVKVLGFGDSGWGSEAQVRLARRMTAGGPWDLAVHVGDLAYDDGTESDFTERHFRVYAELLAGVPFFPVPGNHDLRTRSGEPYDRAFDWPGERSGRRYYSFRWGRMLFVGLDTSTEGELEALEDGSGEQLAWLKRTLAGASADTTLRWTVVLSHYPVYSHGAGLSGHGASPGLRDTLAPLFERTGVDLVLQGHDHHYERTVPVRRKRPAASGCGPVYVVTGGGGASRFARYVAPGPLSARVSRRHHFLELLFEADLVTGRAVAPDGAAVDTFRIRPFEPGDPACSQ